MNPSSPLARRVEIIGIGAGSPGHLTVAAIDAIRRCDVYLVADKGAAKESLVAVRRGVVERWRGEREARFVTVDDPARGPDAERGSAEYAEAVRAWHAARTSAYLGVLDALAPEASVGFLVWGDPAFYDSTVRIVDALAAHRTLDVHITPGITAFQALAAAHGVVLHDVGRPVHVTTGRRLLDTYDGVEPAELGGVVVMLDGALTCRHLATRHPDLTLVWGAQLGLASQRLVRGRLADVIDEAVAARAEVRARDGWVMDVYALLP